jgi:hypothetical protein
LKLASINLLTSIIFRNWLTYCWNFLASIDQKLKFASIIWPPDEICQHQLDNSWICHNQLTNFWNSLNLMDQLLKFTSINWSSAKIILAPWTDSWNNLASIDYLLKFDRNNWLTDEILFHQNSKIPNLAFINLPKDEIILNQLTDCWNSLTN